MSPNEYQKLAERTESKKFDAISERMADEDKMIRLQHAAFGFCTEAGEFMDMLKKHIFYGNELDEINLAEELGDLLWYVALACNAMDINLEDVMTKNLKKLHGKTGRYKDQFTEEEALHRNLDVERKTLEGEDE
jgi:NTP pyrophosphatase (non-canonical NTP hydrolase)